MRNLIVAVLLLATHGAQSVAPVQVVQVPGYTEGVVFDPQGHAYISLPYQSAIYRTGALGEEKTTPGSLFRLDLPKNPRP